VRKKPLLLLFLLVCVLSSQAVYGQEGDASQPDTVVIAGTIQSVLGCPGDWQPECENTALEFSREDNVWTASFDLPAGEYAYKVALNGTWDENYGGAADANGPDVVLTLAEDATVTFIYDHATHWVADSVGDLILTAPGSYQSEIGCASGGVGGDWDPGCLRSWLQNPDGDTIYTLTIPALPEGAYMVKAALNQTWDVNYGAEGSPGGADIPFEVPAGGGSVTFEFDAATNILTPTVGEMIGELEIGPQYPPVNITQQAAVWAARDTILWNLPEMPEGTVYRLVYSDNGRIRFNPDLAVSISGGRNVILEPGQLREDLAQRYPHLVGYDVFTLPADALELVPEILRGQFVVTATAADRTLTATGLQIAGVLDDIYSGAALSVPLGLNWDGDVPTISVWAPTAQTVRLHRFSDSNPDTSAEALDMTRDDASGVWSITGEPGWRYQFYLFEVTVFVPSTGQIETNLVTDPYSVSLAINSARSQIVDILNDPSLMPEGWAETVKPPLEAPEDIVIYELHVRDFSAFDESVPQEHRGTFMAFTHTDSNGMRHLQSLAQAGLTHIELLPAFDIATINEDPAQRAEPDFAALAGMTRDSEEQQAMLAETRNTDSFNWGYDPYHFNAPEGSYSTNPDGVQRIVEFRQMVQSLNQSGLRVIMDVVYNHTNASGQSERSVFDRIVPGYYHRLSATGSVETSTCCQNTASENAMMGRFIVDSTVFWARAYRVDGYRFDLMGHHMRSNLEEVRSALDGLTLEADGVDGSAMYILGEGWNFGEVADNARGVNATQANMAGTGIGTFNDRLRDAVRGGSPFGDREQPGFISGLYTFPTELANGTEEEQLARLLMFGDQIRIGMAGNLREYAFVGAAGEPIIGLDILYNDSPAAYTADPQENIVYISKHDNETIWDIILYKHLDLPVSELVRINNLGLSTVMFSQGIPFFHAGDDLLRSKSLDRNSYDSGDWYNRVDWTYQTNNFGVGLPPAGDNGDRYDVLQPLLANTAYDVTPEDIENARQHFLEILQIRRSSPLFRLRTAEDIQQRMVFFNTGPEQTPGVIVYALNDGTDSADIDPQHDLIVVIINARPEAYQFSDATFAELDFELHPVFAESHDPIVRESAFADGAFNVPARTAAVFVVRDADAQAQMGSVMADANAVNGIDVPLFTGVLITGILALLLPIVLVTLFSVVRAAATTGGSEGE
jgi:pullulanase